MRAIAIAMFIAVTAIILGSLLLGCGTESDGDMDLRYEQCLDAGGSFEKDYNNWECHVPERSPSAY